MKLRLLLLLVSINLLPALPAIAQRGGGKSGTESSNTLAEPVSGKVGVWAKTDSVSFFDDFPVTK